MKKYNKNLFPVMVAIIVFLLLSVAYMYPALEGKTVSQHDISMHIGQSKELVDFRNETGKNALWTNQTFCGMPGYMISTTYPSNLLRKIHSGLMLFGWRPVSFVFLYLLGFYLALLAFNVDRWLSIVGAIAYCFTSYLFIIIVAGHNSKVMALGYMPVIIGGINLAFRGKYIWGALMFGLALGLQILVFHLQMTYYTLIIILIFGLFELVYAIKDKRIKQLSTAVVVLVIAALLAIGSNMGSFLTTKEYGKYSIRGKSELTTNVDNKTSGLDRDYATRWSYGIDESFTLLIPNFMGGSTISELPTDSETYKLLSKYQGKSNAKKAIKQIPTYWGKQPNTAGPVYVGAVVCFLFVLGLYIVDKKYRWWLLIATVMSLIFAYGKNVPNITNFLLDHMPGYNKFRAVTKALIIAGFTMPLLAILAVDKIIKGGFNKKKTTKALLYSFGITGGLTLFFYLFATSLFDFESSYDEHYLKQGANELVNAMQLDRAMLLRRDAIRSFLFIAIAFGSLWLYVQKKLKKEYVIVALGLLILFDMWGVDKRYLNEDNFVSKRDYIEPFTPSQADKLIQQDTDPNFKVLNLTTDPFNDASSCYFHKSLGGYHGAKMRRYQELIENHIYRDMQNIIGSLQKNGLSKIDSILSKTEVFNMLNTKYFIYNPQAPPLKNSYTNGNAWFVQDYQIVNNANEENEVLALISTKRKAVIDKRFSEIIDGFNISFDSSATIKLDTYKPNYLKYSSKSSSEQLAVFSEIYYPVGWNVTIDGKSAEHFRANYILRAMVIPEGEHTIEFSFKPSSYYTGEKISLASSLTLILLLIGAVAREVKNKLTKERQ